MHGASRRRSSIRTARAYQAHTLVGERRRNVLWRAPWHGDTDVAVAHRRPCREGGGAWKVCDRPEVERWPGRDPERSPEIPWETAGFRWERHREEHRPAFARELAGDVLRGDRLLVSQRSEDPGEQLVL